MFMEFSVGFVEKFVVDVVGGECVFVCLSWE